MEDMSCSIALKFNGCWSQVQGVLPSHDQTYVQCLNLAIISSLGIIYGGILRDLTGICEPGTYEIDCQHLAASKGYEDITSFLIRHPVDINLKDKFGNTPLLEAIKNGHDNLAALLIKEGASLNIDDAGSYLCTAVAKGDSDFLRRLLSNGVDPNSRDYDHRTPLHVAASEGLYIMAKLLIEAGASVFSKDRYLWDIDFTWYL
ncbi:hypothetical protein GOBAR_DD23408 [Gossypium barbadense]|nr:hypothetical protein GOBAR_DD23408 [Gossypium barbadense]